MNLVYIRGWGPAPMDGLVFYLPDWTGISGGRQVKKVVNSNGTAFLKTVKVPSQDIGEMVGSKWAYGAF
jgi:hypothetical protein